MGLRLPIRAPDLGASVMAFPAAHVNSFAGLAKH